MVASRKGYEATTRHGKQGPGGSVPQLLTYGQWVKGNESVGQMFDPFALHGPVWMYLELALGYGSVCWEMIDKHVEK